MTPSLSRNTTDTTATSTTWHSALEYPQSESKSTPQSQSRSRSHLSSYSQDGESHAVYPNPNSHSMSSETASRRSSMTYSPPHESTQNQEHHEPPAPPPQSSSCTPTSPIPAFFAGPPRRHSAYLASHPHPYHPLPSPCSSIPTTPSQTSIHVLSSPSSDDHISSTRTRAYSTSAVLPPRSSHPARGNRDNQNNHSGRRWFHGPAPCSSDSPELARTLTNPRTRLEREISRDERDIQMYGGDAIREPPVKLPSSMMGTAVPEEVEVAGEPEAARDGEIPEGERIQGVDVDEEATIDVNLVGWDGPGDPENPQNWSVRYKWVVTGICILMTVNVTFASSAPSIASQSVMREFGISREVSNLITTTFLLGYVFGPLFWGPGSELTGRKPIFILTLTLYTLFHLGQTLAQNIQTLLVTRFLSGFFAVAPLTNCGGVIADIWPAVGRGPATSLFTASVFLGPVLGPIISGFIIQQGVNWRWVFWVMMFFAAGCTLITIPLLPETYAPVILLKKVKRLRKEDPIGNKHLYAEHEKQDWSISGVLNRTLLRPFKMLAMEPILVLITVYLSIVYGLLYALFQAFPIIFTIRHHFTVAQTGLTFIGVGIGTTIGSLINFYSSLNYPKLIAKWRGFPPAEERLIGAMIGSPTLVVGVFWLGWTGEYESVPWYVAGLSTIVVGVGISLIFMSFLSYLVDTYLMYSASAFAANTFCRSAVAAAFPLFTVQMFTALGVNWACTLIGLVALLFLPSPFLFYKYGARIREKSRFAPCIDLKIKKQIEQEERQKEKEASQETKV